MNNRLTARELDSIISVAGDALASETLSEEDDPETAIAAYESGMQKLKRQLEAKRGYAE